MPRNKESVPIVTKFVVSGTLPFPIDMLRYDAAWPASESDSAVIESTMRHDNNGRVEVTVKARGPLTVGRWESFGWTVKRAMEPWE